MLLLLLTLGVGGGEPEPPAATGGGKGRLGRRLGRIRPKPLEIDDDELFEIGVL